MTQEVNLLTEAEWLAWMQKPQSTEKALTDLRERGLIAEEPETPLNRLETAIAEIMASGNDITPYELAVGLQERGMELTPRKELTREMVREMVKAALRDSAAVLEYDDFLPGSPVGPAREADDFVTRLHAAIQEALQ